MKIIVRTNPSLLKRLRRFSKALDLEISSSPAMASLSSPEFEPEFEEDDTQEVPLAAPQVPAEAEAHAEAHLDALPPHAADPGEVLSLLNNVLLVHEPGAAEHVEVVIHESAMGSLATHEDRA